MRARDGNLAGDLGMTVARADGAEGTKLPGGVAWSVKGGATRSERAGERNAGKGWCTRAGPSAAPGQRGGNWAAGVGRTWRGAGPRRWLGRCSREEEEEKADWAEERGCAGN